VDEICKIPYINRIHQNVNEVKTDDLLTLYNDLYEADCIVLLGSGRSFYAASIPLSQLSILTGKTVISPEDIGFPGGDLYEAAHNLDERFDKICVLTCSGSGETTDPKISTYEIASYVREKNREEKFTVDVITSYPDSSIGKIGRKFGHVIELKGRGEKTSSDYGEGIMGDLYELGTSFLLQAVLHGVHHEDERKIFGYIDQRFPLIGKKIDEAEWLYEEIVDIMELRCAIFGAGKGISEKVLKTLLIRLNHVKAIHGETVYMARGINTPRPRKGDLQIAVSCSGETKTVVEWATIFKELGSYQFSIVSNKNSTLAKLSDFVLVLPDREEEIRDFYVDALFVSSPLPLFLLKRYKERGLTIPPQLLSYWHSVIE
jgi:6-phospho-3-hexuloisomerase